MAEQHRRNRVPGKIDLAALVSPPPLEIKNHTMYGQGAITDVVTVSYTSGSGAYRVLVVMVAGVNGSPGSDPTSITYAGVSLTKQTGSNPDTTIKLSVWYLANPATGANNLVITWPYGNTYAAWEVLDIVGGNLYEPVSDWTGAGADTQYPSATVHGDTSEFAVGQVMYWDNDGDVSLDAGSTILDYANIDGAWKCAWGYRAADPSGVTISWTLLTGHTGACMATVIEAA
jgi:hypothetical protein